MRSRLSWLFAALVVTALLVQVDIVDLLPLPVARPDLLVVVVAACALAAGPTGGAVTGFAAGLLADLAPPSDHTIGRLALVYTLVGYLVGHFEQTEERSVLLPIALVGLAGTVSLAGYAVLGALLGEARLGSGHLLRAVLAGGAYDLAVAPFVVPLVAWLARRLRPLAASGSHRW